MEDIQLLDNSNKEENELKINELMKGYLTTTYKWTKFFAILSFITIGIIAIAGIFMFFIGNSMYFPSSLLGLLYLIIAGVCVPLAIFLNRFSDNMKNAISYANNNALQTAFQNLKSYYKYSGVFTIVFISLYILIIFGVIIFAAMYQ